MPFPKLNIPLQYNILLNLEVKEISPSVQLFEKLILKINLLFLMPWLYKNLW